MILSASGVSAANLVTVSLTVTNIPATSNTFYWSAASGSLRTWTNATTASTILTNVAGVNQSATNLFNALANYPLLGVTIGMTNTNTITFRGSSLVVTSGGNWCVLVTNTLTGTNVYEFVGPFDSQPTQIRSNQASEMIYGLGLYPTNALPTNSVALSNFMSLGVGSGGGVQKITSPKIFASFSGNFGMVTGGYSSNLVAENLIVTNLSSPGAGASSMKLGAGAEAAGASALGVGVNASASGANSVALGTAGASGAGTISIGYGAGSAGNESIGIGASVAANFDHTTIIGGEAYANLNGTNGTAIGAGASVSGLAGSSFGFTSAAIGKNSTALGANSAANHTGSTVLGYAGTSTTSNQIMLGTSAEFVEAPGAMLIDGGLRVAGAITNSIMVGSNQWNGDLAYLPVTVTSMAAGVNAAVPGTNVLVEITGTPGAAWSIAGITGGRDGRVITIHNRTGYVMTVSNESGSEPNAAQRISTLQGTDLVTATNSFVELKYNAAITHWEVRNHYP